MIKTIGMGLVATFFCTLARAQSSSPVDLSKKMALLEGELKQEKEMNKTLREQNLALQQRASGDSSASKTNPKLAQAATEEPLSAEWLFYSKIISCYQQKNGTELERMVKLFLKAYPQSVYADNALYLKAKWELASGEFQKSFNTITQLLSLYPEGDKAVSALYTKGLILSRMKQSVAAQEAFKRLLTLYPGSPESHLVLAQKSSQRIE